MMVSLSHALLSAITQNQEGIEVTMPIVGITVVMSGLIVLAFVLKMFVFLDKDRPKREASNVSAKNANTPKHAETGKTGEQPSEEDELTAIALALYLYTAENSGSFPLTYDIEQQQDEWSVGYRYSQTRLFDTWSSLQRSK